MYYFYQLVVISQISLKQYRPNTETELLYINQSINQAEFF